jgi:hypothetical protein
MLEITHAENSNAINDSMGNTYNDYITSVRSRNTTDTEPPEPRMKTDPVNRICHIDKWIILDASVTTDNVDSVDEMTFKWDLDRNADGPDADDSQINDVDATGPIVNLTPTRPGPIYIVLTVSDSSGNTINTTSQPPEEWTIDVIGPDLRLAPLSPEINKFIEVSKKKPKEGEKVKYTVNVTNTGIVTAFDVEVRFLVNGKEKGTKTIAELEQYEWQHVTFKWKATGANNKHNNEHSMFIEISAPPPIPAFEIFAVLIAITIVLVINRKKHN